MRWLAFTMMIMYALKNLFVYGPRGHPPVASLAGKLEDHLIIITNLHRSVKQIRYNSVIKYRL